MAPAVSVTLAGELCLVTSLDVFGDGACGSKPRRKTALWLSPVFTAGRIPGSRRRQRPLRLSPANFRGEPPEQSEVDEHEDCR